MNQGASQQASIITPRFIGGSSADATGTSVTVNYHASTLAGDFLILLMVFGTATPATPSGWTLQDARNAGPLNYGYGLYTKIAGAETSVSTTAGTGACGGMVLTYRDAVRVGAVGTIVAQAGTTIDVATIVPQSGTGFVVSLADDREPSQPGTPTNFTSRFNATNTFWGWRGSDRSFVPSGGTGTVTSSQLNTPNNFDGAGVTIEIRSP